MNRESIGIAGVQRFNRLLDGEAATFYQPATNKLFAFAPLTMEVLSRMETVIQAFTFDTVIKFAARHPAPLILCLDKEESAACVTLRELEYPLEQFDLAPTLNPSLSHYPLGLAAPVYQIVFRSTPFTGSEQDKALFALASSMLAPGGIGVFTMSIERKRQPGDVPPLQTAHSINPTALSEYLLSSADGCSLVGMPDWPSRSSPGDGPLAGEVASLVVQKFPERANGELIPELLRERKLVLDRVILLSGELSKLRKDNVEAIYLANVRQNQLNQLNVELIQLRKERDDAIGLSNARQSQVNQLQNQIHQILTSKTFRWAERVKPWLRPFLPVLKRLLR